MSGARLRFALLCLLFSGAAGAIDTTAPIPDPALQQRHAVT